MLLFDFILFYLLKNNLLKKIKISIWFSKFQPKVNLRKQTKMFEKCSFLKKSVNLEETSRAWNRVRLFSGSGSTSKWNGSLALKINFFLPYLPFPDSISCYKVFLCRISFLREMFCLFLFVKNIFISISELSLEEIQFWKDCFIFCLNHLKWFLKWKIVFKGFV